VILLIDNYDSFTYNLVQRLGELDPNIDLRVFRNDQISPDQIAELRPSHIIVSPGPCTPREAGVSNDVLRRFAPTTPVLGVCLGHQCIGAALGGKVERARRPMHGKTSRIRHDGRGVFESIENDFVATRYHSLVVERASLPACLAVTAQSEDGEIMGLRHRGLAVEGVQFHPEALLTEHGHRLLQNFIQGERR
jgi:anthranilate synthase/aminodeoxychorismate synthase-like glutamine amidotransferase